MSRIKRGTITKKRHKRVLKEAKGFWGQRKNIFRRAKETVLRAMAFAYKGRKLKKRDMRSLFVVRIKAAVEERNMKYNQFMHNLKEADVRLNRKMLSQIAVHDPAVFDEVVKASRSNA